MKYSLSVVVQSTLPESIVVMTQGQSTLHDHDDHCTGRYCYCNTTIACACGDPRMVDGSYVNLLRTT